MISSPDSQTLFGILAAPICSLVVAVFVLILCLGKKKVQESENGIVASSGSYSKGTDLDRSNQNQVYAEPDVVRPHKEEDTSASPQNVVIDIAVANEKSSSLPRMGPRLSTAEGKLWGTDGSPPPPDTPPRPREPTPNLADMRKSVTVTETDPPYATSRQFVLETSGSGETSGNGLYARVKQVERVQDEIAYSVVNLEKKEEDYEFVGNQVRRKSSQDLDKEDFPPPFSGQASATPGLGTGVKKGDGKQERLPSNVEMNALYSQVEETVPPPNKKSYHEDESLSNDLYATVSEVPKQNSLPNNAKGARWKPFKQSKRRSRTVEESSGTPTEDHSKGEKKGSKKKLARLKSDSDEPKNTSPVTPPLPPLENLKSKAKENNWRKSAAEDPAARSSEVTPAGSPRLGALPSIPVTAFDFQRPRAQQEEYDEDDTYEKLGSGGVQAKASSLPKNYDSKKSSDNAVAVSTSVRPQSGLIERRPHTSVTTEGCKYELVVSPSPRGSLSHIPPPQIESAVDGVAGMYAQVNKTRGSASNSSNKNHHAELTISKPDERQEMYATVNKERSQVHKEHVANLGDKGGGQTHAQNTAVGNLYATVDLSKRSEQKTFDSLGVRESRTQSESIKKRQGHGGHIKDTDSSIDSDLLKPRANTEPILDLKAMYAQVDLEKKRKDREIRDTYSLVNKVRTGRKTLHHAEPEVNVGMDTLYEGTYSVIPGTQNSDGHSDGLNDQNSATKRKAGITVNDNYAEVSVGAHAHKDMGTVSAISDGEAYARVDEL